MFNNLVSQQFPVPSMQQHAISSSHMGLLGPMATAPGSLGLVISTTQTGHMESSNLGMHQWFLPTNQSGQTETMMNNVGLKRKAPMEPVSNSHGLQLLAMPNKRVAQVEHRPWLQQISPANISYAQRQSSLNAPGSKHSPAIAKRKVQMESTSGKPGVSRPGNPKIQNAQGKQPPKAQTESSECVRSKMRESLAAALALVSPRDRHQDVANNTQEEAASALRKTDQTSEHIRLPSAATDVAQGKAQEISNPTGSSAATDAVDFVSGENRETATSNEDSSAKIFAHDENDSLKISASDNTQESVEASKYDKQEFQSSYILSTDDIPFSENFFVKDEFLQGNGLSWVLDSDIGLGNQRENQTDEEQKVGSQEVGEDRREQAVQTPELLALKIEAELFKLFGGVNKKYKEKGRSLLFNLKDRNNPELRERVMSGDIPPERLCSMTAEELASKELSEWRIAKAEELAQMVVLPESDVDIRRMVKKTHKGEFQVEVEHDDIVSVEVSGGATSLPQSQSEARDMEATVPSKPNGAKDDVDTGGGKSKSEQNNLAQGLAADYTLKDADYLPPIVSLDEFMQSFNSEPSLGNLAVKPGEMSPILDKSESEVGSESKCPRDPVDGTSDKPEKIDNAFTKVDADLKSSDRHHAELNSEVVCSARKSGGTQPEMKLSGVLSVMKPITGPADIRSDNMKSAHHAEMKSSQSLDEKSGGTNVKSRVSAPARIHNGEQVWEGSLQLNISTPMSVIGNFKSGEKTSAKEWPGFLEIKGRVRLGSFEKFLQELPKSRSRAVMVVHFVSKEGSPDSDHSNLREVADSYVLDERVGFVEPAPGAELYLCPPHRKTVEMLSKILSKEQTEALNAIDNGFIGIIVWRKTHLTSTVSPTSLSHSKHSSKKQHPSSRRHQGLNVNVNSTPKPAPPRDFNTTKTGSLIDDNDDGDVPPGFGPAAARDEDDLPEFNFSGGSNPEVSQFAQQPSREPVTTPFHSQNTSRPVDQVRELIYKYGQTRGTEPSGHWQDNRNVGVTVQPWNDDDDDIPEWQPQPPMTQLTPQHPLQTYHFRPHMVNESHLVSSHQSLQSPVNNVQGQRNYGTWWVPPVQGNNLQPDNIACLPNGGRLYGISSQPAGSIAWRQNVPKSTGF
ncbi:SPOC domain / Transcription elongation factor S-II protein [Quillaja saponaria]|uniref:SPOC domain / Transcription elongation factor S-II protein n=1 Tax=Quillaja saponaria TaxID=32244 RepID=A0AAD7LIC0_QUISA|nr:SPOC domain / Transcription elongation factor S-II protein [Quillaja saponaria]KAJ7958715.1 SPOC domain / Transcription elongation factor S-II protein [Quillaja saponaria]